MQTFAQKKPQETTFLLCGNGQNTTTTRNSGKICLFSVSGAYGARYLDPRTSRWISADPAVSDYIPQAPTDDDARKRNQNLPGMGGVYNVVNLHVYHYAGNNPVKYTDPDGNDFKSVILFLKAYTDAKGTTKPSLIQRIVAKIGDEIIIDKPVSLPQDYARQEQINEMKEKLEKIKENIQGIRESSNTPETNENAIDEGIIQTQEQRDERQEARKEMKKQINEIKTNINQLRERFNKEQE